MQDETRRRFWKGLLRAAGAGVLLVLLVAACRGGGEDRPTIEVIGGEAGSVSVSASASGTGSVSGTGVVSVSGAKTGSASVSAPPAGETTQPALAAPTEFYTPVSSVGSHAAISLDMRDIAGLLEVAKTEESVDWAAITALYEEGKNSVKGDGSVRTLASLAASDSVLAEFPGGAGLDANVQAGLTGRWLGEEIDGQTRRQLINKGMQAIIYGKVLQELTAARAKIEGGNLDDSSGAPHNVDEAWAFYVGAPGDEGNYPYAISSTARKRESNFGLDGMVDGPLQQSLAKALEASKSGDLGAYDEAASEVRGYLNSVFYLATLRYGNRVLDDDEPVGRKVHLAEGWAFYQTIRPAMANASADLASIVEGHFTRDASGPVPAESVNRVFDALNSRPVRQALGIPPDIEVVSPLRTEHYAPVSDVDSHAAIALDMRDIGTLVNAARNGEAVDWMAVTALYEDGGNSVKGDGSLRTLESLASSDSVLAQFPGGTDLDANVRAALTGVWLGESIDDLTRRQLVNKGLQAIMYGKTLQELAAARAKIEQGSTADAGGAPHNVDEAWAFYTGAPDLQGKRKYSIARTARSREGNFGLEGRVDTPLQQALGRALEAARAGDIDRFDAAASASRGYLNTIFYLATLRYGKRVMDDEDAAGRKIHLAEGWAFYQAIRPAVANASADSASIVEGHFTRDASGSVSAEDVERLYAALNEAAVIQALGIPANVRVTSPSQLR